MASIAKLHLPPPPALSPGSSPAASQACALHTQQPCPLLPQLPGSLAYGVRHTSLPSPSPEVRASRKLLRAAAPGSALIPEGRFCSALSKVLAKGLKKPHTPATPQPPPCPLPQGSASCVHPGSLSFLPRQPGLGQGTSQSVISVQLCPMTAVPWKRHPLLPSAPGATPRPLPEQPSCSRERSHSHAGYSPGQSSLPSSLSPLSLPLSGREEGLSPGPTID